MYVGLAKKKPLVLIDCYCLFIVDFFALIIYQPITICIFY